MWRYAHAKTIRYKPVSSVPTFVFNRRSLAGLAPETIEVPVRSNGSIKLDIYHPNHVAPSAVSGPPTILLYLPKGGSSSSDDDACIISALRSELPFSLVRVNYRLNYENRYPTPVHDVITAFDFAVDHLLPRRGITRAGRSEHVGRIAVCGQWIGGGLAAALALTECRIRQPGIVAAAICNPIVDWPRIDEEEGTDGLQTELLQLRRKLFRKPEHYFDPFASPILFFRSAGRAVPPPPVDAPVNDLEHLAFLEREELYREQLALSAVSNHHPGPVNTEKEVLRKASKRYPGSSLGLRLPVFNIGTGAGSPVRDQVMELAQALRKSHLRQEAASDFGKKVLLDDEIDELDEEDRQAELAKRSAAANKAQLTVHTGLGWWDASSPTGRARVTEAARWLRSVLS